MRFFFDEAGDFVLPETTPAHRNAVVAGIAISDPALSALEVEFRGFVSRLDSTEIQGGEPKGKLLSYEHKRDFCELLAKFDGVQVTPATLELSNLTPSAEEASRNRMLEAMERNADARLHEEAREQLHLAVRQYRNLSTAQGLRLYALARCIREAIQNAIFFLAGGIHRSSWCDVTFEIDRVQTKAGSREERLFWVLLRGWLVGWSVSRPFGFIDELHTADHPIMKLYDTPEGFSLGALLKDGPTWRDSATSWGVQVADIAASIIYGAVQDLDDRRGSASLFAALMRSCPYGPARGPGLFSPLPDTPDEIAAKYMVLSEVMQGGRDVVSQPVAVD